MKSTDTKFEQFIHKCEPNECNYINLSYMIKDSVNSNHNKASDVAVYVYRYGCDHTTNYKSHLVLYKGLFKVFIFCYL